MLVCHCKGITDRDIRKALLEGALTRDDIERACRAGSACGDAAGRSVSWRRR